MCAYIYTHIAHIYIYTYTYIHTYIHTYKYGGFPSGERGPWGFVQAVFSVKVQGSFSSHTCW